MTGTHDIVILGGGLVGTALALALAAPGFSVALVDPVAVDTRAAPEFDGRAYAFAPGSARFLTVLGLWDSLRERAEPVKRIEVVDRMTGPVPPAVLHFDPAESGQSELGWIVEDGALRLALLTALAPAGVTHLAPAAGFIEDRGTGWALVRAADRTLRARLVIACDGRRSATARAAGIDYLAWSYRQSGLVSAVAHQRPHFGVAHQSFFPGGPFAVLPLQGDRSALVWSDDTDRAKAVEAMSDADFMAEISARIAGRLGALQPAGPRRVHPLGLSLAQEYCVHRLVLAGDAAHGVHPIAGQGLNLGLRDAAALAEVLADAARRGEDIGTVDVLCRYQRWRRPDAVAMALGMDALNRGFSTPDPAAQAVRNIGLRAVGRSTAVRRDFMAEAAGAAGDVPRMLQGLAV